MAQSIFLGPSSYGPDQDSPRVVEEKLNANFTELYALNPSLTGQQTIRLTYSADNGTPDSVMVTQAKINAMLSELSGAAGTSYEPLSLDPTLPFANGMGQEVSRKLSQLFTQLAAVPAMPVFYLSNTAVTRGSAFTTSITGGVAGATFTASGLPAGLTLNSGARTITGTTNDSAGTKPITITQTRSGYYGSPRTVNFNLVLT